MSLRKSPDLKIGNVAPFGLRMLPDLKEKMEKAAAESGRSLNAEIVARLEASLDQPAHGNVFGVAMSLSKEDRDKAAVMAAAMEKLFTTNYDRVLARAVDVQKSADLVIDNGDGSVTVVEVKKLPKPARGGGAFKGKTSEHDILHAPKKTIID